jgi:hypothetical protein
MESKDNLGRKSKEGLIMIPNINKQIVNKITSDPDLNKNISNKFVQDTLSNIKKYENKEATASGGSGQYSAPLFGDMKESETLNNELDKLPKLKDLKQHGLKYSVKGLKNVLVKKTKPDGTYGDNKFNKESAMFPEKLDVLNMLIQSRLGAFYFKTQLKKRGKDAYNWGEFIKKEDLDNFPIPQAIFDGLVKILADKDVKKTETKEATSSSSSGSYVTPQVWAKSSTKKNWRGARKTQIPGGKFVEVRKKCQKFPYCNQGDIKSLKIFENERIDEVIKNISKKHNISENVIKNILLYELDVFRKYKK